MNSDPEVLEIEVKEIELFNPKTSEIYTVPNVFLKLKHTLVSISKWEAKYHKPFISRVSHTVPETIDYIRFMNIGNDVDDIVYSNLGLSNYKKIEEYISDSMSGTTINRKNQKGSREVLTSEVIYAYMFINNIPKECESWHLNRLLTLIDVCSIKNNPNQKKMSAKDITAQYAAINKQRRAALGTKG